MNSLPVRLDEELYLRAKSINEYVAAMLALFDAASDNDEHMAGLCMRRVEQRLKSPYYQRAIATSMDALKPYLDDSSIEFFNKRGGLSKAHTTTRVTWPAEAGK